MDNTGLIMVMGADGERSARLCDQLALSGWRTARAATPAEASSAVCGGGVDVVILHVSDCSADATDLPAMLRVESGVSYLPVIVLNFRLDEQTSCRFLNAGADDVAGDDISPAELDARLRALARGKALNDELYVSKEALSASLQRERALMKQLRRDNAHLLTLSTTDPLTHLQNIRHFDSFLENEFRITRRYNRRLSLLALDLDHFKIVNDMYGHPSGDYVLKEFAVILERTVRDSDVVARTGGEEFSIILPDAGRDQARQFAQRIRQEVNRRKFIVFGQTIHVTTSIGLASYPEDAEITDPHMLVYLADQALLRAKQLGRDRFVALSDLDAPTRYQFRRQYQASTPRHSRTKVDPLIAADVRR